MSARRYILHPGYVVAENGDRRYVGFHDLVRLYGLRKGSCVFFPTDPATQATMGHRPSDVHLHPRPAGDYNLKAAVKAAR